MALQDILRNTAAWLQRRSREALNWYRDAITRISGGRRPPPNQPPTDNIFRRTGRPELGKLYIYTYNPRLREKLPFFDMYPLTIILNFYQGPNGTGFLGLNLHYLPPLARASLLQILITNHRNNNELDETTRLNLIYPQLRQYAGLYEPCVKRYLLGHVVSSFHEVHPRDWEHVVMLPLQRWVTNPNRRQVRLPF